MRGGVVNCLLVTAPRRGWRPVWGSAQRTRLDWAHCVREVVEVHYPDAGRIVLVMDQAISAWAAGRKATTRRIDWQFTTTDARTTLRRLYPAYDN